MYVHVHIRIHTYIQNVHVTVFMNPACQHFISITTCEVHKDIWNAVTIKTQEQKECKTKKCEQPAEFWGVCLGCVHEAH